MHFCSPLYVKLFFIGFYMWGKKLSLKRKLSSPKPLSSKKLQLGFEFYFLFRLFDD